MVVEMRDRANIFMIEKVVHALQKKGFDVLISEKNSSGCQIVGVGPGTNLDFFEGERLAGVKAIHENNERFLEAPNDFVEAWQFFKM